MFVLVFWVKLTLVYNVNLTYYTTIINYNLLFMTLTDTLW